MLGLAGVGLAAVLYACGEVGGAGQCNGVDVLGACMTIQSIAPQDGSGESTNDVDAFQNPDCDGDATTSDSEPFTSHTAVVTLTMDLMPNVTSPPAPEFVTIEGYSVTYTPSPTNTVSAPPLTGQTFGETIKIGAGETVEAELEMVPLQIKDEYVAAGGAFEGAIYRAVYTFQGKSQFNEEFAIGGNTTFTIGAFNNCGASSE